MPLTPNDEFDGLSAEGGEPETEESTLEASAQLTSNATGSGTIKVTG